MVMRRYSLPLPSNGWEHLQVTFWRIISPVAPQRNFKSKLVWVLGKWLDLGHGIGYRIGLVLIIAVIGSAVYAQWIQPDADVNDVMHEVLRWVPRWMLWTLIILLLPGIVLFLLRRCRPRSSGPQSQALSA